MTYNLPLLRKERDWVAEQLAKPQRESRLEMAWWFLTEDEATNMLDKSCGTTCCVAGHVAEATPGFAWVESRATFNGERVNIAEWAGKELGLDSEDADWLFNSTNDQVLGILDDLITRGEAEEREQQ